MIQINIPLLLYFETVISEIRVITLPPQILGSQDQAQYVYEKSRMEPQREVMRAWSRNITHARIVTVGETITYRGLDDGRTLLTQESAVSAAF